jgi:hypothetical protein
VIETREYEHAVGLVVVRLALDPKVSSPARYMCIGTSGLGSTEWKPVEQCSSSPSLSRLRRGACGVIAYLKACNL